MRRPHALHPPAFLIDEHRRVGAADDGAEVVGERAQLRPIDDIALEEDQSPRLRVAEKRAVVVAEPRPGAAKTAARIMRVSTPPGVRTKSILGDETIAAPGLQFRAQRARVALERPLTRTR